MKMKKNYKCPKCGAPEFIVMLSTAFKYDVEDNSLRIPIGVTVKLPLHIHGTGMANQVAHCSGCEHKGPLKGFVVEEQA